MLVIILSFHEYVAAIDFPSHDITIRIGLPIRIGYRRMAFIDARFMQMGLSQVTGIWGLVLWLWMHLIQCHSVTIIILNFYQETWNILAFSVNSRHSMVIEVFPCGWQGTIWRSTLRNLAVLRYLQIKMNKNIKTQVWYHQNQAWTHP